MIVKYTSLLFSFIALTTNAKKSNSIAQIPIKKELSNGEMAAAGALATVFGVVVMHPVDTIKTLQQSTGGAGLSMIAASNKILKDGGIGAMYSGLGPYLASDGSAGALKFATYEVLKKWIREKVPEEHYGKALFVAAAAAFMASSVVLVPGELLKQRLQMGQIPSVRKGVAQIFKNEGILGFYAGYSGVCLRDIPYTMLELGIYDNFKSLYLTFRERNEANQWDELVAAAISGGITAFLTAPLDNIKTKLMVDAGYNGFFDCLGKTVNKGGFSALFNGSAARVAWLLPFTAIYLPCYELIKRKMETMPSSMSSVMGVKGGSIHQRKPILKKRPAPVMQSLKLKTTRFAGSACF